MGITNRKKNGKMKSHKSSILIKGSLKEKEGGKRMENGLERKDERKQESRVGYGTHASRLQPIMRNRKRQKTRNILCTPEETRQDGRKGKQKIVKS
jgi:hypothetical protein